ncbi:MAG: hypothetical protein CL464_09980 [Acidimicrobiaceae bacterium]|nr:hypothetical protein [Acidimicrobiaceae bacterium]
MPATFSDLADVFLGLVEVLSPSLAWFVAHQFGPKQGLGQELVPNTTLADELDPTEKNSCAADTTKNASATAPIPATRSRSSTRSSIAPQ